MSANNAEMNMPPEEFQARLAYLGGLNRYDEPIFRIWWSQYAYGDGSFRAGGVWSVDEKYYRGYRDLLRGSGEPCFCLGQWNAPEEYGSPEGYYVENFDESTGLSLLGEFPYSGRVELLYNLRWHEREDDKLVLHTMPLNTTTFDAIIPIIIAAKDISLEKRKAAYIDARKREEDEKLAGVERHLRDTHIPNAGGSVSYTRQGIRSPLIDKKRLAMQQNWQQITARARALPKGMSTK